MSLNRTDFGKLMFGVLCIIEAYFLIAYSRVATTCIIVFPVAAFLYYFHRYKDKNKKKFDKNKILYYIIAFFMSITVILCKHMVVDFNDFYSNIFSNYIEVYKWTDMLALCALVHTFSAIFFGSVDLLSRINLYKFLINKELNCKSPEGCTGISSSKEMTVISGIIFGCWIPYFVKYYPGLIYSDSTLSLSQALGQLPYNNHHPIIYTLFIKVCLAIGRSIGGENTIGVAIYSVLQMMFMSTVFAYSVCWLKNKQISKWVCYIIVAFFAVPRFWAQHAISMWKDPVYSVLVFFFSLKLFDIICSKGEVLKKKSFTIQAILCVLGISFLRNNGIYVLGFSFAVLIAASFVQKRKWFINRKFILLMLGSLLFACIIQGPVYKKLGIASDPVESYGVPLQQVARTVVYDGKMTDNEQEFLNKLMPIDKYVENYSPGLVDHFKWSDEFNTEFFNKHQKKFIKIWLSLFKKNPKLYFEAWALNTCGFWGVNYWELNGFTQNISMGVPRGEELKNAYQIEVRNNGSETEEKQTYFSLVTPMPSIAICLWITLGMISVAVIKRKLRYVIIFAPCIGNILTLMLASPITYWPRYGLSFICLLPICILFPAIIKSIDVL